MLLTQLTHAIATLLMARRGVLAQQLNSVESLASTDVICLGKTGTLTEPALPMLEVLAAPGIKDAALADTLGRYAASSPSRNAILAAISERFRPAPATYNAQVPFSSRRRWSAFGQSP